MEVNKIIINDKEADAVFINNGVLFSTEVQTNNTENENMYDSDNTADDAS